MPAAKNKRTLHDCSLKAVRALAKGVRALALSGAAIGCGPCNSGTSTRHPPALYPFGTVGLIEHRDVGVVSFV